jgi:hypothetical protein
MIRSRIRELRYVAANELKTRLRWHSFSATVHTAQLLGKIGFCDALLTRELPDGSLELLDGALRASLAADQVVPVLVVDLDDKEAELMRKVYRYRRGRRPNIKKLLEK